MKVLGICCSPRKDGNTENLIKEVFRGSALEGAETDLFSVSGKHIEPCDGCRSCNLTGICVIKDDMQVLYQKMVSADSLIFSTPTYNYGMAAHRLN
jgi:multimeric flavodoxin WrbA